MSLGGITYITDHNKKSAVSETRAKILKPPPKPLYDLGIMWNPSVLNFEIEDEEIVRKLR